MGEPVNSGVVWEGISPVPHAKHRLAVVLTGLTRPSQNRKTGPMVQSWIIRPDVDPVYASRTGDDDAYCGNCEGRAARKDGGDNTHRKGWCYVNKLHGPRQAWETARQGVWVPDLSILRNRQIRLGAYGDPGMVPYELWDRLIRATGRPNSHTGYTATWREEWADQRLKDFCMASVQSDEEALLAERMGWRTYQIVPSFENLRRNQTPCREATHGETCSQCMLCSGGDRRKGSIVITPSGRPDQKVALTVKRDLPLRRTPLPQGASHVPVRI